jgi:hypothetical protein
MIWTPGPLETIKQAMRLEHARNDIASRFSRAEDQYKMALEAAISFWTQYELLNRNYCPDDPVYSVSFSQTPTAATDDLTTFLAIASRQWRILEIIIGAEGTASAAARTILTRSTGGTTATNKTPELFNPNSPTSMFGTTNIAVDWTTHPSTTGAPILSWGYNAFGGFIDWKPAPGEEYNVVNTQVSLKQQVGTPALSHTVVWEEM